MKRSSGILFHPTSLPGRYGIGTLGKAAFEFVDFMVRSKQKIWQILPLGPTGYADSPYQCFSSNAGNPLLIDLDTLVEEGFLTSQEIESVPVFGDDKVDYGRLIELKYPLLKKAANTFFERFAPETRKGYQDFTRANAHWLNDYALFMALKEHFNQEPWYKWETPLKLKSIHSLPNYLVLLNDSIEFHKFIQYLFFKQWMAVKQYANEKGVKIMGDIPLYVALDSVDAWSMPEIFQFNKDKNPVAVGGVPPDYFSATGQLWGNPLFNWDTLKRDGYRWWINRIKANLVLYDIIRIDHFRGFAGFYAVPYGEETAIKGEWLPGPGKELFETIKRELGNLPIVAEDLGVMTPDVEDLRDSFNLPGMKILQFAFDSGEENDFLPHNYPKNCVVYTGTHDNDTVVGWLSKAKEEDKKYLREYLNSTGQDLVWDLIRVAMASVADTAVFPMQDLLVLGNDARMNLPGTTSNNWQWRAKRSDFSSELAERLARMTVLYGRSE
jgi:4-alpha-glucanotransferase